MITTSGVALPLRAPWEHYLTKLVTRRNLAAIGGLIGGALAVAGTRKRLSGGAPKDRICGWELHPAWNSTGGILVHEDAPVALVPPGVELGDEALVGFWRRAEWAGADALAAGGSPETCAPVSVADVLEQVGDARVWVEERTRWQLHHLTWLAELMPAESEALLAERSRLNAEFDAAFADAELLEQTFLQEFERRLRAELKERPWDEAKNRTTAVMARVREYIDEYGPAVAGRRLGRTGLDRWVPDPDVIAAFAASIRRDHVQLNLEVVPPAPLDRRAG